MPLALAAALAVVASAGTAPSTPIALVACAPGYPGTTAEARPSMDAFAAALARAAGWPEGSVAGVYLPQEKDGLARLSKPDAAVALVTLPFWVKHGAALGLDPRLEVVTQGAKGPTEEWSLVAKKGRVTSAASLAGFTIASSAGYAPGFVRGVLAGFGALPASARIVDSTQVLSWLRKAATGADAAVLLDGQQAAAIASLPFASDLEVVARSAQLPVAFVATVGKRLTAARWSALDEAFLAIRSDPRGEAALQGIRMTQFVPADPKAVAAARALAGRAR